ncbi:MAG: glycosyltransferase family 4 protein [Bacilli bacterium]|nr:glycosyltransferase family 4 protein [Methanobrevibacter sp.]MBR0059828.1 glycosyltransferase family 4 protein [Methanobrevibacter sp.]MBR0440153.1 glycosyltransferase family 4 protein [Bacilli bacterium]
MFDCWKNVKNLKMKMLYVVDSVAVYGGIERVLIDKVNSLAELYHYDISLVRVYQGNHMLPYSIAPSINQIDLQIPMHQQYEYSGISRLFKRYQLKIRLKSRFKKTIEELKPDIIVCVKLDFVGILIELKGSIPLIVESHTLCKMEKNESIGWLRRLYVKYLKRCIRNADAVVSLTEGDAAEWRTISNNVFVIPNVVNLNKSDYYSSCNKKSVIYVGRFSYQKDIDSLLQIWGKVHLCHPDWRLDIYGDGELRDYYVDKIQTMDANIFVFEPVENINEKYCEHSLLLLTSLYEPFGLVLPEAMSCGLPVVAFDCPYGPADIVTDGVDGFLIKDRNIISFVQRVCQLIENNDLRCQMGACGICSSQRYCSDNIMPRWIKLFESINLKI